MRKIKFRGKSVTSGDWVKGSLFYRRGGTPYIAQTRVDKYLIDCRNEEWWDMDEIEVDPETVGQFAELIDLHKNEIYDGDIIKYIDEYEGEESYGVVTFGTCDLECNLGEYQYVVHGWYALRLSISEDEFMRSEILTQEMINGNVVIVGNKWDNPELLKGVD